MRKRIKYDQSQETNPTAVSVPRKGSAGVSYFGCSPAVVGDCIMGKIDYIPGQLINGIVFIKEIDRDGRPTRRGRFVCPFCGTGFDASISHIRYGGTKSCGCVSSYFNARKKTTHGMTNGPLYDTWNGIKRRCYGANTRAYEYYGGRGIAMCDEWRIDFKVFYDYVVSLENYGEEGYTLDRIDNDGNYEPGNLRWSTRHNQVVNQRVRKNKTGYTGVAFSEGRFRSTISVNKTCFSLGGYNDKKDALEARNNYIIENELWEYPIQKWRG